MPDQANPLRQLMLASTAQQGPSRGLRPRLVLVAGGRSGVGTTTMALNLAVAMAQRGTRAALIDADSDSGDVATLCRLDDAHSLADVLAGRSTVAGALQPGPGGIHVLAGIWAIERVSDYPKTACDSLIGQFGTLGDTADWILADVGLASGAMARRLCHAADLVLLVSTPDNEAIMDTYAAIKTLATRQPPTLPAVLFNAVPRTPESDAAPNRLSLACRRFLGFEPSAIGCVESDSEVRRAAGLGDPFVLSMPTSTVARQVYRAARNLCSLPILLRRGA